MEINFLMCKNIFFHKNIFNGEPKVEFLIGLSSDRFRAKNWTKTEMPSIRPNFARLNVPVSSSLG